MTAATTRPSSRPLTGRTVLVTGASKGLGLAVVERIAAEGADVLAHHRSGDLTEARAAADRHGVSFADFRADLAQIDDVRALGEWATSHGPVHGLVNNAGICTFTDFFDITVEAWDRELAINTRAAFFLTQAVTRQMVARGVPGRVVNFSSVAAHAGTPQQVHYGAAKAAVEGMTTNAATALGQYGITVNAVVPGPVPTEHNSRFLEDPDARARLFDVLPMGRYGSPGDVAGAVAYFLSDAAGWTTGSLLTVDGGLLSV